MKQTEIEIKILQNETLVKLDESVLKNAIVENKPPVWYVLSQITVTGQYNRKYNVATFYREVTPENVLIDNNLLFVCLYDEIAVIDLEKDKLVNMIDICRTELFQICKLKEGYFIHGELNNYYLDKNFNVVWELGCADIFYTNKVEKIVEVFDEYITVFDWYGVKHFYNEQGEFKTEYYPECAAKYSDS